MKKSRKKVLVMIAVMLFCVVAVPVFELLFLPRHEHCIKQAMMIFYCYADENQGKYPESEKGWGDAILKLGELDDSKSWIPCVVGVDDDGSHLLKAMASGGDVDESKCTRVYVQGLNVDSHPEIALIFDRDSVPGGDHGRSLFGEPLRELITVGGGHKMVKDRDWISYVVRQRKLLREHGFSEERIAEVYGRYK